MIYTLANKRLFNRRFKFHMTWISVLAVFIILSEIIVPHFIPAIFNTIARPFWHMEFSVKSGSLDSPSSLLSQNESLKRTISDMQEREKIYDFVFAENEELRQIYNKASTSDYILSAVLAKPPFSKYDQLVIDVGSSKGVMVGQQVLAPNKTIIGKITSVNSSNSIAELFTSYGQKFQVSIGEKHINAVAKGVGGGQYEAEVSRNDSINVGDVVTGSIISNKVLGTVSAIISNPTEPFSQIIIVPEVNIYDLRWVLIDKKNNEKNI